MKVGYICSPGYCVGQTPYHHAMALPVMSSGHNKRCRGGCRRRGRLSTQHFKCVGHTGIWYEVLVFLDAHYFNVASTMLHFNVASTCCIWMGAC